VIVDTDMQIVSTGYNGCPFLMTNCGDGGCPRCNSNAKEGESNDKCFCIHAEENAIIVAGRVRARGCSLYVTTYPCVLCAKMVVQAGIKKVFYYKDYASKISKQFVSESPLELE
jgi:dCMP deaminase